MDLTDSVRPAYYVWEITNRCNLACAWCYDSSHGRGSRELGIDGIKAGLDNLTEMGCEVLNISGREPTMRGDLREIVDSTMQRGIRPTLSTNGIRLLDEYEDLLYKIDTVSVPLDSANETINNEIRRGAYNHYKAVLGVLEYFGNNHPASRLKVNTLAERRSLSTIPDIGYLMPYADIWRISKVQRQGDAKRVWDSLAITDEEFENLLREIRLRKEKGDYAHIGRVNYKRYRDAGDGVYPLPIISSNGGLYFPGENEFETGLYVQDRDFARKYSDLLGGMPDLGRRNRELFQRSYE